jgi:hypothetical protein
LSLKSQVIFEVKLLIFVLNIVNIFGFQAADFLVIGVFTRLIALFLLLLLRYYFGFLLRLFKIRGSSKRSSLWNKRRILYPAG